jgi:hypothetical protein
MQQMINQMSNSKRFYKMEMNHGSSNIMDMILSYKQNTAESKPQGYAIKYLDWCFWTATGNTCELAHTGPHDYMIQQLCVKQYFYSVHLVITKYSVTLFGLFVRKWGNKLLQQGIKIRT